MFIDEIGIFNVQITKVGFRILDNNIVDLIGFIIQFYFIFDINKIE